MTNDTSYRTKGRAVFLAAIMVLSMVAMSAALAGSAAAQDQSTTRGDLTSVTAWQGQVINVSGFNASETVALEQGTNQSADNVRYLQADSNGYVEVDTSDLASDGDAPYVLVDSGGTNSGAFWVRHEDPAFEFSAGSTNQGTVFLNYTDGDRTADHNVTITAENNGSAVSASDLESILPYTNATDSDANSVEVHGVGPGTSLSTDFGGQAAGPYNFTISVTDSNAETTASITVGEAAEGDVTLEEGAPSVMQGNIAEIPISTQGGYGGGNIGFALSEVNEGGYWLNATVDTADSMTLYLNTYTLGHSNQANVTNASDVIWAEDGDGNTLDVTLDDEANLNNIIASGVEYNIDIGTDLDNAHNAPRAVGSLFISERTNDSSMSMYRAPSDTTLGSAADITGAMGDSLTQTDTVVTGANELLVHHIQLSGSDGLYQTVNGANDTLSFQNLVDNGSVSLTMDQQGTTGNIQPVSVDVSTVNGVNVVEDFANDSVYVTVDLSAVPNAQDVDTGMEFQSTYTTSDAHLLGNSNTGPLTGAADDGTESVSAAFATAAEDSTFESDPLVVPPESGATISGSSNLAPTTTGTVVVSSTDAEERFRRVDEEVEVGSDGSFAAEFDLTDTTQDDAFTASARSGISISSVSGTIGEGMADANLQASVDAPPETVTVGDSASLEVSVENTGEQSGSAPWSITVAGEEVDSGTAELDGGSSTSASYDFETSETGDIEWSVSFNGSEADSGTLTVEEEEPTDDETTGETDTGNESDTGDGDDGGDGGDGQPGFGIAVALFALIGAALLALRRQD